MKKISLYDERIEKNRFHKKSYKSNVRYEFPDQIIEDFEV